MSRGFRLFQHIRNGLILLAFCAFPTALTAQETVGPPDVTREPPPSDAIGPPQLREFQLPGTRVVPAQPQPTQPIGLTPPAPPPAPGAVERTQPSVRSKASPALVPQAPPVEPRPAPAVAPPPVEPVPTAGLVPSPLPEPEPAPVLPPAAEMPAEPGSTFSWAYALATAAGLGLVGLLLFAMRTRRRQAEPYAANHASTEGPASPQPTPLSVKRDIEPVRPIARRPEGLDDELLLTPQAEIPEVTDDDPPAFLVRPAAQAEDPEPLLLVSPVHDGVVGIQLRPWLEIQFKPDKATATATEATVQFNLIIANTGNAAASNIRVHACMFNAGLTLEQEIQDYFAAPIPESSAVIPTLSPRNATSMSSVVAMPKQLVREIEVQGRRLFIPTVAFNVCYEWGNGKTGRTSMSFLVGRESETPSSKMGPFRLDQGPRVYRQIGQRQSQPALLV